VREAVVASTDQTAAVGMMLRTGAMLDPAAIGADLRLVADGRVSPILLWEKHPVVIVGLGFLTLLVLLLLHRLLFARRRTSAAA
jgi:threonine dehydrogenase-like Zn-dependent dehydrogenase